MKWWTVDEILSADHCHDLHSRAVLHPALQCCGSNPAQPSTPDLQAQLRPAGVRSCSAPSCLQMGTENCILKAQLRRVLQLTSRRPYSSLASQALPPPRPAFLEEGSAVFKEQQFFPLSWLPRSSAEKQKEAEGPALEIIYQCKTLWEIFSNMCNCIRIYTHAHIRI